MLDLLFGSATSMAEAIRTKQISSEELVRAHIERIKTVNPIINAIVQFRPEEALQEARSADADLARGHLRGLLHGVPFTVKDYMAITGVVSTFGTLGLANTVMDHDCEVVKRLRGAGGIALGNTNMPEFGASSESDNLIYGRTNNPYDLSRFPGGSSGGESAMIAAGGSPLGVGGDSGGSIREPAHYCGIAGLKPTTGRIPRSGFLLQSRDATSAKAQNGPMARYVADLYLGMKILSGPDRRDPSTMPVALGNPDNVDIKSLRVAYYTDNGIVPCDPEVIATVMKAVDVLRDAGVQSIEEAAPPELGNAHLIHGKLSAGSGVDAARAGLKALGTEQISDYMEYVLKLSASRPPLSLSEFLQLTVEWDICKENMMRFMDNYDLIICPTTSIAAMPHRSTIEDHNIFLSYTYSAIFNVTGWPAASVRCGTSAEGLPIGVQTAALPWREDIVLAAAQLLELALGGYQRPPL
jgi:amidase